MRAPFPGLPAERIPPLSWQSTDYVCPMAWWGWIHLLCVVVDTKLWIDALLSVELHCRRKHISGNYHTHNRCSYILRIRAVYNC